MVASNAQHATLNALTSTPYILNDCSTVTVAHPVQAGTTGAAHAVSALAHCA